MIQFLETSVRPLLVDELSEILTIDYDTGTTPKYEAIWHPETPEADIFTVCHNLVVTDWINGLKYVQFAHCSVPEFFFSDRILEDVVPIRVKRYHCNMRDSHWVALQTCIAQLLHFDDNLKTAARPRDGQDLHDVKLRRGALAASRAIRGHGHQGRCPAGHRTPLRTGNHVCRLDMAVRHGQPHAGLHGYRAS
jgi:hypothetical protein